MIDYFLDRDQNDFFCFLAPSAAVRLFANVFSAADILLLAAAATKGLPAFLDSDDWVAATQAATAGRGVDVVYDSVGKQTFMRSLDCLRPRGLMVTYGNASGAVEPFAPLELTRRGSLYVTRPTLFHYVATRPALARAAQELFDVLARSVVRVQIGQSYPLREAARAHMDLESRRTIGSTVLVP